MVLAAIAEIDIDMIDVSAAFERHPDPLSLFPFRMNGHYNADGYALAAKTITEALKSNAITRSE